MTIQDLGSIGELVGAVATVATLLYLALQIRQNSQLFRASIAQAHREGNVEIQRVTAGDAESARVFRIGLRDPSALSETEKFQFDSQLGLIFSFWEQAQGQDSLRDTQLRWTLSQPGGRAFWSEFREVYSDSLAARVEAILAEEGDA